MSLRVFIVKKDYRINQVNTCIFQIKSFHLSEGGSSLRLQQSSARYLPVATAAALPNIVVQRTSSAYP